ncbi:MAG: porin [Phycisphaerales bacterium]
MQRRLILAAALSGSIMVITPAATALAQDNPSEAELRARVAELEKKMADMDAAQQDGRMTEARAAEVRAIVHDVLADADTRASLLQGGMTAGWDRKFFLASSDGNFKMNVEGQMQFRWVLNLQDEQAGDSTRYGFENRRTKLNFNGHVFDPTWEYEVQGAFDRDGGSFILETATITRDLGNDWYVKFGQFKPGFMREELTSSKRQLAVERSLVNEEFNQDYTQGIEVGYAGEQFKIWGSFDDGFGSDNTAALAEDVEYSLTGRAEILFAGSWDQFKDFTSWKDEEFAFMMGAAGHVEREESGTPGSAEETVFTWTIDASLEFGGANIFAAVVGRHFDESDADQFGFVLQGGVFLTDDWEAFARFEWGDMDVSGQDDLLVATVGVNRYWKKHSLKWTTDIGIGLNEVASGWSSSGAGWRGDASDEDGQVVVRSQLQLLF